MPAMPRLDGRVTTLENVRMLQEVFNEYGLKPSSFEKDVGVTRSCIGHWASGRAPASDDIFKAIEKRGKILSSINLRKNDFDTVCERFGIKKSIIAERLGISKQALHDQQSRGIPDDRLKKIESIIREIGQELVKLAKKAL